MQKLLGMFPDKTVLAVDGGASKADLALVDVRGTVLAAMRRRGSFHFGLGYNGSLNSLADAIKAIPRRRGVDSSPAIAALGVFCLAGADIPIDDRRIADAARTARACALRDVAAHRGHGGGLHREAGQLQAERERPTGFPGGRRR